MTKLLMLVAIILQGATVSAQVTERTIVRAGEDLGPAISPTGHYRFGEFTPGILKMKYGSISKARFNVHICNGEIQFIDPKGDTLAIAQAEFVDNLTIGENTRFVYVDKLTYEIVSETPSRKLGK